MTGVQTCALPISEDSGVPSEYLLPDEVVQRNMQAKQEAAAAAMQMQMMEQGAKAVGAVGGPEGIKQLSQAA